MGVVRAQLIAFLRWILFRSDLTPFPAITTCLNPPYLSITLTLTRPPYSIPAYTHSGAPPPHHGSRPYGRDSRDGHDSRRGGYPDARRRSSPPRSYDTRPATSDSRDPHDNRAPAALDDRSPNRDMVDRDGRRASHGRSASPRRDLARSARSVSSRRSASPRPANGHAAHDDDRERRDD